jgi:hypothetical protein
MKLKLKFSWVAATVLFVACQGNKKEVETVTDNRDKDTVAVVDLKQIDSCYQKSKQPQFHFCFE